MGPDELDRLFSLGGMDRRRFLKVSALIAAGLVVPLGCKRPQTIESVPEEEEVRLKMPPAPSGIAAVGIARKSDIAEMVNSAISLAGGLEEIRNGDRVVIKPNLTTGYTLETRVTTHPEVLRAVIRAVKARTGSANITVAEASSYADPSTLDVARKVGIYDVILSEGVNWLAFEEDVYVDAFSSDFRHLNFILKIPKSLTDNSFHHFINVPMLKNHEAIKKSNVDFTCCLKNHVGILERQKRLQGGGKGIHTAELGENVAELNLIVPVHTMNIVDALTVITSGGPASSEMTAAHPGLVLASKDRVACDSLALAVLRHYASLHGIERPYVGKPVWEQTQIVRAQQLNLGREKARIKVASDGVDEIDSIMAMWD